MNPKNARIARRLEHKTGRMTIRFRGPRMDRTGIRTAVGTTALLGSVFRLLNAPCPADGGTELDAERREESP